jgi:GNAT superfamily N-acetyltransferase
LNPAVVVRPVHTRADLNRFVALPYALHRDDPVWVPPLRRDIYTVLSKKKNPFFRRASADYFLAERGSTVVGRIAAIENPVHNEYHDDKVGFFGFFECIDDQAVADALFDAAAEWLRKRGLDTMRGPASPSTNDECGLVVEGFGTPPTILNPHNPEYYVRLVEGSGFAKAKDLYQYQSPSDELPERLNKAAAMVQKRFNITLRPIDMKRFKEEVDGIKPLYNGAWEKNWGFVPMSEPEIDHLATQLKPVVVSDLVVFAERNGETIGFAVAIPDFNVALKANRSGRLFPGIFKVLWRSRKIHRVRILLLGVIKEFRGKGAAELMYHWIWTKGTALGYNWGEAGWVLEDNGPMNKGLEFMGFERYKTLRMYDRPL